MSSNIYLIIVDEQTKDVNIKKIAKEPSKQKRNIGYGSERFSFKKENRKNLLKEIIFFYLGSFI